MGPRDAGEDTRNAVRTVDRVEAKWNYTGRTFQNMTYTSADMRVGHIAWLLVGAMGCATAGPTTPQSGPPPPQDMDPARALGLWQSNFGAVKIEPNTATGGLQAGGVHGVWQYDRQGQAVVGYFFGTLRGNVLSFQWQEPAKGPSYGAPASPPLGGEGFIVFDQAGRQYSGRWWSSSRDRGGLWNGWRQPVKPYAPNPTAAPEPQQPPMPQSQLQPPQSPPLSSSQQQNPSPQSQPPPLPQPPPVQGPQSPYPVAPRPGPQQPLTYD